MHPRGHLCLNNLHDPQAWLKHLKGESRLDRFGAATLFVLAGIQRFAVPAADLLKVAIPLAIPQPSNHRMNLMLDPTNPEIIWACWSLVLLLIDMFIK